MSYCTRWVDRGNIVCRAWADRLEHTCVDWAAQRIRECSERAQTRREACQQWADEGHDECSAWADEGHNECCDWAPCSWFCDALVWVAEWVCHGWYWVSNWVCTAWHTVVEWVCIAWHWVVIAVCVAWAWVVRGFCTAWAWMAKLVCVVWTNAVCWVLIAVRWVRRKRHATPGSPRIRHVFVLMLENRSFDHMFGFSDIRGTDSITGQPTQIDNLLGNPQSNIDPATGNPVFAAQPADFALSGEVSDPGHEFHDTLEQLAGSGAVWPSGGTPSYPPIDNSGYVANFRGRGSVSPEKAMHCYAPDQLPILNTLAREFAVCDTGSVPCPVRPGRTALFVHAASSAGLDDSPGSLGHRHHDPHRRLSLRQRQHLRPARGQMPRLAGVRRRRDAAGVLAQRHELQRAAGTLPRFRGLPRFSQRQAVSRLVHLHRTELRQHHADGRREDFTCGNSQHPLDDVTRGERLIKDVYEAVRNSPHWESSVIIVTHDEHGGFFDHVVPPPAVHPGDSITDNGEQPSTTSTSRRPARACRPW